MSQKLRVGILGCGKFSVNFTRLFLAHPYVEKVVCADTEPEKAKAFGEKFSINYFTSLDQLLQTDINAVAIFTPRHTHGPLVIQALKAGKHVYSAVPMASEITHCQEIVKLVEETHLTYMMGETCVYYPCSMFCKEKTESNEFGKFIYGEAQYHHDIAHFSSHHQSDIKALGSPLSTTPPTPLG